MSACRLFPSAITNYNNNKANKHSLNNHSLQSRHQSLSTRSRLNVSHYYSFTFMSFPPGYGGQPGYAPQGGLPQAPAFPQPQPGYGAPGMDAW